MKKLFLVGNIIFIEIYSAMAVSLAASTNSVWEKVMTELINPIFTLLIVVTFTYFLFGVMSFIFNLSKGASDEDLNNGKRHMLWGGFGLFIVFSISGIIKLLNSMFNGWFSY